MIRKIYDKIIFLSLKICGSYDTPDRVLHEYIRCTAYNTHAENVLNLLHKHINNNIDNVNNNAYCIDNFAFPLW